ncbi:MAG: FtsX-like permease family protein [Bacteroidales bacterium]|nr:FtsX-like permease family protein [Bacteroidales bacterium]
MIWSIAWRNVWRNKLRSIIVLAAITVGLFAGVFSSGFYKGMADARLKTGIKTEVSHIQIHQPEYTLNKEIKLFVNNSDEIVDQINKMSVVEGASRRIIAECFFKTAHGTRGVKIVGIEPEREKIVTDIYSHLREGSYLKEEKRIPRILIGQKLGEKLRLKIGSKIPVDIIDIDGNFSSKLYKVGGFFETNNTGFDESVVFVRFQELRAQLNLPEDVAHEIAIYLQTDADLSTTKEELEKKYPGLEVKSWREISKELAMMTDSMDQYMYIFVLIILLALCFGIINTMLMVVLERTKELGMLMAIGMNRFRVFLMIIFESVFLSLSGGFLGITIGYGVIKIFEKRPIVLDMFKGFEQYGYSSEVYTSLPLRMAFNLTILVFFLGIISAIYPAWKAIRLNPSDALRTE